MSGITGRVPTCPASGKVCYPSKAHARTAVIALLERRPFKNRKVRVSTLVYECDACGYVHFTSPPNPNVKQSRRFKR